MMNFSSLKHWCRGCFHQIQIHSVIDLWCIRNYNLLLFHPSRCHSISTCDTSDDDLIFKNYFLFPSLEPATATNNDITFCWYFMDEWVEVVVECVHTTKDGGDERQGKAIWENEKKKMTMYHRCLQCWLTMTLQDLFSFGCSHVSFPLSMRSLWYALRKGGIMDAFWFKFWDENVHNLKFEKWNDVSFISSERIR